MEKRIFLIDGSNFIFRAFYAIRHLSTSTGIPTNAVTGFANMIQKLLREHKPTHVGVIFDTKEPTFRHEMYPDYKANREEPPPDLIPQFGLIRQLVDAFRWKRLEIPGYEADDIIATLTKKAREEGFDVVLVSSDKDLCQLLDEKVRMLDTMKDKWTGPEDLRERFGGGPEAVIDVLALAGDTSDNVPGVPGVGEKTAVKLLEQFGSLDAILEKAGEIPGKLGERIRENKDKVLLSHELVRLKSDMDLPLGPDDFLVAEPDREALREILTRLEMTRLLAGIESPPDQAETGADKKTQTPLGKKTRLVTDAGALEKMAAELREAGSFTFEIETTHPEPMRAEIVGMAFYGNGSDDWYLPLTHSYLGVPGQVPLKEALAVLKPLFEDPSVKKIGQNVKNAWIVLRNEGVDLAGVELDTMVGAYLLNPEVGVHNLEVLAQRFLGRLTRTLKEVTQSGRQSTGLDALPVETAGEWAAQNVRAVSEIGRLVRPRIEEDGLARLLNEVEMPLIEVLVEMERAGVLIDRDLFKRLSKEAEGRLAELETQIWQEAGTKFNLNSPKQIAEILFEKLGLPSGKRTKTGLSTDVAVLEKLAETHPVPKLLLEYRGFFKLKSTYIDALPSLINPKTGRLHTCLNQCVTTTGRLSSTDPNLQNIPIRTPEGRRIREGFIAAPGRLLLSSDYSQVELRLMAHLSHDEAMIHAFHSNADIHRATAAEVFGVAPDAVTPEMRRQAKVINFGIIYGMSAFRLGKDLEIGTHQAKEFIDAYFRRFAGVRRFIDTQIETARRDGYVTTLMGRRRPVPELRSHSHMEEGFGERIAVNTPLQGSAADLIKMAMVNLHKRIVEEKLPAAMILQVHDEIVLEVDEDAAPKVMDIVRETMQNVIRLDVPIVADAAFAKNWADAH